VVGIRRFLILGLVLCLLFAGSPTAQASEEPLHVLLVGLDRRPGETGCRSDCVMLLTFHPELQTITMTSFLRDLYVPIPGYGENRLNAAYALGGSKLLEKTVKNLLQVEIQGTIAVDFTQFPQIVDALGGVNITLRKDEARFIRNNCGGSLTEGPNLLTGQQTLCYCRIRSLDPDGDFSRTRRQRTVLQSILEQLRSAPTSSLLQTVSTVLPMVSTNINPLQLLHLVFSTLPSASEIQVNKLRIPFDGTYSNKEIHQMQVIVANWEENRRLFRQSVLP